MVGRKAKEEEVELQGRKMPKVRKPRHDGWTAARKEAFLAHLETTCNISASLRKVGLSAPSLRYLCKRDGAFRAEMRATIAAAHTRLQFFALEKMMAGTVKTVTKADGSKETVHEYPLHLALHLLRLHKETAAEFETEQPGEQVDEAVRRLLRKIAAVRRREGRDGAEGEPGGGGTGGGETGAAGESGA